MLVGVGLQAPGGFRPVAQRLLELEEAGHVDQADELAETLEGVNPAAAMWMLRNDLCARVDQLHHEAQHATGERRRVLEEHLSTARAEIDRCGLLLHGEPATQGAPLVPLSEILSSSDWPF